MATMSLKVGGINHDGTSKVVEIDESYFFKRTYNRGHATEGQWFVGGIERGTKKAFIVPVAQRNSETIRGIIYDCVLPWTTIITDKWRAYKAALRDSPDFEHKSVNHSLNFIDPEDPSVHTQSIEGLWSF